jgi:hypothetical protein
MSIYGLLLFAIGNQAPVLERMSEEDEIARNRGRERVDDLDFDTCRM